MATTTADHTTAVAGAARRGHHPGAALAVLAGTQLMIVLDATIVNIALPHVQSALHFSATSLSWVLNAYTLTFGGLLLLGGRLGDIMGRRRMLQAGILLFAVASLLGGLAQNSGELLTFRALQGVGGALASPTALALITTNFAEGEERNRAFGVFAAVSGSGAAIGLLAGGALTSWVGWRWVFFVNVPIGIALAVLGPLFINESERKPGQFDLAGALTSTLGMTGLVYGFINAAQHGWGKSTTIGSFVASAILLTMFFVIERRTREPITPLHLFANRNRASTYVIMLFLAAALFSMFFFLTQFVQEVLGYSPIKAGVAFLPVSAGIIISATICSRFLVKTGPKPFLMVGAVMATGGLAWLSQISVSSTYITGILGPMVIFALGMGFLFVPLTMLAVSKVSNEDSGAASSLLNVMQQVGGSLGLSVLVTVYGTVARHKTVSLLKLHPDAATSVQFKTTGILPGSLGHQVLAKGASAGFAVAVLFAIVSLVVSFVGIKAGKDDVDMSAVGGVG
ncbi:MFS transporter [Acidothermaceae bacterium B102]|nr:MFS transporter [Acidothermaceae bacterium B102]